METLERRDLLATIQWDGGPGGNGIDWHEPTNWEGDVLPGADDDVVVGETFASSTILANEDWTIRTLQSSASLVLDGGRYELLEDGSRVDGAWILLGGEFQVGGDLDIAGSAIWRDAFVNGFGRTRVLAGAQLLVAGDTAIYEDMSVKVDGTFAISDGSLLLHGFVDVIAGEMDIQGDFHTFGNGIISVDEFGKLRKTEGTGAAAIAVRTRSFGGTIEVLAGSLRFEDTLTANDGNFVIANNASMQFAGHGHGVHQIDVDAITGSGVIFISDGFDGRVQLQRVATFEPLLQLDNGAIEVGTDLTIPRLAFLEGGGEIYGDSIISHTVDVIGRAIFNEDLRVQFTEVNVFENGWLQMFANGTFESLSLGKSSRAEFVDETIVTSNITIAGSDARIDVGAGTLSAGFLTANRLITSHDFSYSLNAVNSAFAVGILDLLGGSLAGAGLVVQERMEWHRESRLKGTDQPGQTIIAEGATVNISPETLYDNLVLDNHTLLNLGTANVQGHPQGGRFALTNKANIINVGELNLLDRASINILDELPNEPSRVINQEGTIRVLANTPTTIDSVFDNQGELMVTSNTLLLRGGGSSTGNIDIAAGATLSTIGITATRTYDWEVPQEKHISGGGTLFVGNNLTFRGAGTIDIGLLEVAGTLTLNRDLELPVVRFSAGRIEGDHDFQISNTLNWQAGSMAGQGTTYILPDAVLIKSTGSTAELANSRRLVNQGTVDVRTGSLRFSLGTEFENTAGAVHLRENGVLELRDESNMINAGEFYKYGAHTLNWNGSLLNSGTIHILGGVISLSGGGSNSGSILLDDMASLRLGGRAFVFNHTGLHSRLEGGTLDFVNQVTLVGFGGLFPNHLMAGGTLNLQRDLRLPLVSLMGGAIAGTGALIVSGTFNADNGRIIEDAGLVIEFGATAVVGPSGIRYQASRDLVNSGTLSIIASHLGAGAIYLDSPVTFYNYGAIVVDNPASISGITASFHNEGMLHKTGDGLLSVSTQVTNQGTVFADNSKIHLLQGTTNYVPAGNGTFALDGGSWIVSQSENTVAELLIQGITEIHSLAGDAKLILDGPANLAHFRNTSQQEILSQLTSISKEASLELRGDYKLSPETNSFEMQGSLYLGPASTLTLDGQYTSDVNSQLTIALGGPPASLRYGQIAATGSALLDGDFKVEFVDGFGPTQGQVFVPFTYSDLNGDFVGIEVPLLGAQRSLEVLRTTSEVQLNALVSASDLQIVQNSIKVPETAMAGGPATIEYMVENLTLTQAEGDWLDSLYLSRDSELDGSDLLITRHTHTGGLAGQSNYSETVDVTIPIGLDDEYRVIVVADSRGLVPDVQRNNNISNSTGVVSVAVQELSLGETLTTVIKHHEPQIFKLVVPPGKDVVVSAELANVLQADLYLKFGDVPTRSNFDLSATDPRFQKHQLAISERSGDWYILLYGRELADGQQPLQLTAAEAGLEVNRVEPRSLRNLGQVTLTLEGFGFASDTEVELFDGDGKVVSPVSIRAANAQQMSAVFDLSGVAAGNYQLRVRRSGSESLYFREIPIQDGGRPGELEFEVVSTDRVLPKYMAIGITIRYANAGDTDVQVLPIEFLDTGGQPNSILQPVGLLLGQDRQLTGEDSRTFSLAKGLQGGVLPPGGTAEYVLNFDVAQNHPSDPVLDFTVRTPLTDLEEEFDWQAVRSRSRPAWLPIDGWGVVFENFVESVGPTLGDLQSAMGDAIAYLMDVGMPVELLDPDTVLGFMFAIADNSLGGEVLSASVDAQVPGEGLPLTFSRFYKQSISSRFNRQYRGVSGVPTALGRGWTHNFEWYIADRDRESKTFLIQTPTGYRVFKQLDRCTGSFTQGCTPSYKEVGGSALFDSIAGVVTEPNGTRYIFQLGGRKLQTIRDQHGNAIQLEYAGDQLVRLSHSGGDEFILEYNDDRVLTKLIDQAGRETLYSYDATSEHLLEVDGPDGHWQYQYELGQIDAQHALTMVTRPNGTLLQYEYDEHGRVQKVLAPGMEPVQVSYDQGRVTYQTTDELTFTIAYDAVGQVLALQDAQGETTKLEFDSQHYLSKLVLPGDLAYDYSYSKLGILSQIVNPQAERISTTTLPQRRLEGFIENEFVSFREGPIFGIENLTDELGRKTEYRYEATRSYANISQIIYPDGAVEEFSAYDEQGSLTEYQNRRDETVRLQYNPRGQLARRDHDDGSFEEFTYDNRGNLRSARGPHGRIDFEYDALDRLIMASYPGDRSLAYSYNAFNQLVQIADHAGHATRYEYDAAGRLVRLEDGDRALIVAYTYDALGRLVREDQGNKAYTLYTYEPQGRLEAITHHAPDDALMSRLEYQYDALGRRTQMTTLEGIWSYGYDSIGQLIRAEFVSSNPALPDQLFQCDYDAAGNRIRTTTNGLAASYGVNSRNQYTHAGDATNSYDADGNLLFVDYSDPGATDVRYTYDDLSRLKSVEAGIDRWSYEYDALGNRIATVHNGDRTEYLVDVVGLSDVVAEYDNAGELVSYYAHGLGIESQTDAAGNTAYYQFDALGSTIGLTDATGDYLNRYHYDPYGAQFVAPTEAVDNPFQFVGQLGVMQEEHGLQFMRARYYSPYSGRFINEDPIGHAGGLNLYQYARNQPTQLVDPTGLDSLRLSLGKVSLTMDANSRQIVNVALSEGDLSLKIRSDPARLRDALEFAHGVPDSLGKLGTQIESLANRTTRTISSFVGGTASLLINIFSSLPDRSIVGRLGTTAVRSLGIVSNRFLCNLLDCEEGETLKSKLITVVGSFDPNDIAGPSGQGPEHFMRDDYAFSYPYTIRFENLDEATAPAQRVVVTQQLDDDLDWTTFELSSFSFGDLVVDIPGQSSFYQQRIDAVESLGVYVDFTAGVDMLTGTATWEFIALDPFTLDLPMDPLVGFLPPNMTSPQGQGSVSYAVRPKESAQDGTRISAQASIVFDNNEAIVTNNYLNRIDAAAPTSHVDTLPETSTEASFTLNWSGQDGNGSGIASFDILVSTNGGDFEPWLTATSQTSASFSGERGSSYAFFSVASDNVGYHEPWPSVPDATVTVIDSFPWNNSALPVDVSDDRFVSPIDALLVINYLNQFGGGELPAPGANLSAPPYYDVNADRFASPIDALIVINYLNQLGSGESEKVDALAYRGAFPSQWLPNRKPVVFEWAKYENSNDMIYSHGLNSTHSGSPDSSEFTLQDKGRSSGDLNSIDEEIHGLDALCDSPILSELVDLALIESLDQEFDF